MYCPKCGLPQTSDETTYCSRCGTSLNGLAEFVEGAFSRPIEIVDQNSKGKNKRYMTLGVLFMFLIAFLTALLGMGAPRGHPGPVIVLVIAWVMLMMLIYLRPLLRFLIKGSAYPAPISELTEGGKKPGSDGIKNRLPEMSAQPMPFEIRKEPVTTAINVPPSITEDTTDLLER